MAASEATVSSSSSISHLPESSEARDSTAIGQATPAALAEAAVALRTTICSYIPHRSSRRISGDAARSAVDSELASLRDRGMCLSDVVAHAAPAIDPYPASLTETFEARHTREVQRASFMGARRTLFGADPPISLLLFASFTHDIDIILTLAHAGARAGVGEDVYTALLGVDGTSDVYYRDPTTSMLAPVPDQQLAEALRALHACGVTTPGSREGRPLGATWGLAYNGKWSCVRAIVEGIDHHPHACDGYGRTLLHIAASMLQADLCEYLMRAGWDRSARDGHGFSPLGLCLTSHVLASSSSVTSLLATLTALLQDCADARAVLHECGVCLTPQRVMRHPISIASRGRFVTGDNLNMMAYSDLTRVQVRIMMCLLAAVGVYSELPCMALMLSQVHNMTWEASSLLREFDASPLDLHPACAPHVHIRDPFRVSGDLQLTIRFACAVDGLQALDVRPQAYSMDWWRRALHVWVEKVAPFMKRGVSATIRSWAWMRRLHAVMHTAAAAQQRRRRSVAARQ